MFPATAGFPNLPPSTIAPTPPRRMEQPRPPGCQRRPAITGREQYRPAFPRTLNETILNTGATAPMYTSFGSERLISTGWPRRTSRTGPAMPQSAIPGPLRVFRHAGTNLSVILCDSLQIKRPVLKQEEQMETTGSSTSVKDDVLHLGSATKLSDEEIAKAVAHHNRHHGGNKEQAGAAQAASGRKPQARKPGK